MQERKQMTHAISTSHRRACGCDPLRTTIRYWLSREFKAPLQVSFLCIAITFACTVQAAPNSVYLDELTWTEARDALQAGKTTLIIPIGGTEQSGPHIALGKHNFRAKVLAGRIAEKLGNALVAPVVAYVPEGHIAPPAGHMRFTGTISIPEDAFVALLAGAGRSMKQHGFLDVVYIGDHGGYQNLLKGVAQQLNHEWVATKTRAHYVPAYYRSADAAFAQALRARGFATEQIGSHAGLADTSLMMAIDPGRVRENQLGSKSAADVSFGVFGNPAASSAALGRVGADLIIDNSVRSIKEATVRRP